MERVDKHLLLHTIFALSNIHAEMRGQNAASLAESTTSGKPDSLYLDVFPELMLNFQMIDEYDSNMVFITEEKGGFNYDSIRESEIVFFADPTDRSKHLAKFIKKSIDLHFSGQNPSFGELLDSPDAIELWNDVIRDGYPNQETKYDPRITGPCCSVTATKRGEILFNVILNYLTQEIFLNCSLFSGFQNVSNIPKEVEKIKLSGFQNISFEVPKENYSYVGYLGKQYKNILEQTQLLGSNFKPVENEPGGPLRILYLSNLCNEPTGFIFSVGEKIGEWIGWLSFCRHSNNRLVAYSVYPDTVFARDDILMAPSPPYSILESQEDHLFLNYEKLKFLQNPSRYREMIIVTHRDNLSVRAHIQAKKSRLLFGGERSINN